MNRVPFCLVAAAVGATGCGSQPASPDATRGIIAAWSGSQGGEPAYSVRTIQTAAAWKAFWKQVEQDPPRGLDPVREMAVAISLGERRTGGYGLTIVGTQVEEGKLVVDYQARTPAPDMSVTQALTTPWALAIVPRSELPIFARKAASPSGAVTPKSAP